ncbi:MULTISPECIES: hypothetical protein [unclassified Terriglobus]|uniref:hypothetical protein n=1 Tax=unclassified Terriglobus TaxID=2628988 RepID=UPI003F9C35AA
MIAALRVNLQFRAEALNAFNTPQFARPNTTLTFSKTDLASGTHTSTPSSTNTSTGSITVAVGILAHHSARRAPELLKTPAAQHKSSGRDSY